MFKYHPLDKTWEQTTTLLLYVVFSNISYLSLLNGSFEKLHIYQKLREFLKVVYTKNCIGKHKTTFFRTFQNLGWKMVANKWLRHKSIKGNIFYNIFWTQQLKYQRSLWEHSYRHLSACLHTFVRCAFHLKAIINLKNTCKGWFNKVYPFKRAR